MVSTETLQVIINAKDMLSNKVKQVNDTIKQTGTSATSSSNIASNATNKIGTAYERLRSKVTSVFSNIKEVIKNSSVGTAINESGLAKPFLNAAEKIKQKWTSMTETIKSKLKISGGTVNLSNVQQAEQHLEVLRKKINQINNTSMKPRFEMTTLKSADGQIKVIVKDLEKLNNSQININTIEGRRALEQLDAKMNDVIRKSRELSQSGAGFNISPAGLATLNGQMEVTKTKMGSLQTSVSNVKSHFGGLSSSLEQSAMSMRNLKNDTSGLGQGFSVLKGALAGVVAMVGYDLVSGLVEGARASINARGNIEAFSKRLKMSGTELSNYKNQLNQLQGQFRKVDMQAVGASALELANKLGVPTSKLGDLTKMTAVMSSAFLREGRTSEDAILAVSDALDGQFRRLQEIGITQDMLKANGWNGNLEDTASLIDAINKTMDELGITETAMQITNLDDAWQVLNVSMSHLLTEILIPLTPILVGLIMAFADLAGAISSWWASMPDGAKIAFIATVLGALGAVIYGYVIVAIKDLIFAWLFAETSMIATIWPILAVGAAIGALALIIYEVGKAMGWWTDGASAMKVVGDALRNAFNQLVACLTAVYNGLMQVVSPAITDFWNQLVTVVQPLKNAFMELWKQLLSLGDAFGGASGSGSLFVDIGKLLGAIIVVIIDYIKMFMSILIPVVTFIVQTITNIIQFLTMLKTAIDLLMQGDIIGFLSTIGEALITFMLSVITNIGLLFLSILSNLGIISMQSLQMVWDWIVQLVTGFVTGAVLAVTGFISWISSLPGQFWAWLMDAINKVLAWKNQLVSNFRTAATNAINGFISYIQGLPGKFWTWLVNTYNKVSSFKSTLVQKISDAARSVVDNFKSKISSLPTVMWNELMNIKSKIQNAAGSLGAAIRNLGSNLLSQFKSALGIASPGHMSHAIEDEMGYIGDNISNAYNILKRKAAKLGNSIMSGFNSTMGSLDANVNGGNIGYNVSHDINEPSQSNRNKLLEKIVDLLDKLDLDNNNISNVVSGDANAVRVVNDGKVTLRYELDFINAPAGMSNSDVEEIVRNILSEKETLKQLTNNREFQDLDKRMKVKILSELSRHI